MAEKLALKPGEAAEVIGVSRSKVYALIAEGQIPHCKIGSSIRVPVDGLRRWLEMKTADTVAGLRAV